jgi:hypothetical protein
VLSQEEKILCFENNPSNLLLNFFFFRVRKRRKERVTQFPFLENQVEREKR